MLIVAIIAWVVVGTVVVAVLLLGDLGAPSTDAYPQPVHPHAAMRIVFVTTRRGCVVVDGLLDLATSTAGVPTTWTFELPSSPALAAAALRVLERWAEDGAPVGLDLSRVHSHHPSVALMRDELLVRLCPLARPAREQAEQ